MSTQKTTKVAIPDDQKETIQDRLKQLFKGRNLRQVAKDWGMPYSTLNNYFSKGTKPGLDVIEHVCDVESISLEWLIAGRESRPTTPQSTSKPSVPTINEEPTKTDNERAAMRAAWEVIFNSLGDDEAKALLSLFVLRGVQGVIKLAQERETAADILSRLDADEQERLLALHEAKKGAPTDSEGDELNDPTHRHAS